MTLPSHGAVRSSVHAAAESATRSMRSAPSSSASSSLLACAGGVNALGSSAQSSRSFTSSPSLSSLRQPSRPPPPPLSSGIIPPSTFRMEAQKRTSRVWNPSRGFVFSDDSRVVYPRLPPARFYSAPAVVSRAGTESEASFVANTVVSLSTLVVDSDARDGQNLVKTALPGEDGPCIGEHPGVSESSTESKKDPVPEEPTDDPTALEPPFTPLEYKIPADIFRAAKQAGADSPESYWSYNMYRGPGENGALDAKIKVHYCTSLHTTERVLQQYFMDEKLLGFDLEWEASASSHQGARKNVSLVQLASENRIALFHLALYPGASSLVAPSLKKIMEDQTVTKVGVAIKGDCTRMRKFLDIDSKGVFELSNLYKLVKYSTSGEYQYINKRLVSLATQVQEHLCLPMFKGQDVRSSSWSQALKMDQIVYSASDAYAAVQLYAILNHQRENLDPTPPLPYFVEYNLPIRLADGIELPAAEDPPTEQQDNAATTTTGPRRALSEQDIQSISDSLTIEEAEPGEPILLPAQPPSDITSATTPNNKSSPPPQDTRVIEATTSAADFRSAHPIPANNAKSGTTHAAQYQLRAYYLWHMNEDLGPHEVAALLRNPPLQTNTVVNYILESIRLERLQYDKARLKRELLSGLPKEMLTMARYKGFVKACEGEGGESEK